MKERMYVYRFRPMGAVLHGYQELAKQEIHLASPKDLNDPMEGYKDVFWQGDPILWRNLLRHYVLCLLRAYMECLLMTEDDFEQPTICGALTETDLPTDAYRSLYRETVEMFFSEDRVRQWFEILSEWSEPVCKEQLLFHLSHVHQFAIQAVIAAFAKNGVLPGPAPQIPPTARLNLETLRDLKSRPEGRAAVMDLLWEVGAEIISQQNLRLMYNQRTQASAQTSKKRDWLMLQFPAHYIDALIEWLIHPPWYTACFSSSCDNASMWSTYADHHRGMALMFSVEEDPSGDCSLPLEGVTGSSFVAGRDPKSTPLFGVSPHRLHRVNYSTGATRVDFFRFISQLPHPSLLRTWWCDENSHLSPRVADVGSDMEKWRNELWGFFDESATRKLPDWEHEREYRVVVADILGSRRKYPFLKYDFGSLAGVVFGMRTSIDDKMEVMKIMESKCRARGRTDFQFLEARYSSSAGRLIISTMDLLRFAQAGEQDPGKPGIDP